jgi:transposase
VFKAYLLKGSLEKLWDYRYEGTMLNYLESWMDQLKWQRLRPFEELAEMLVKHLEGILNYCRTKVRFQHAGDCLTIFSSSSSTLFPNA